MVEDRGSTGSVRECPPVLPLPLLVSGPEVVVAAIERVTTVCVRCVRSADLDRGDATGGCPTRGCSD